MITDRIVIAGDWHMNTEWAVAAIRVTRNLLDCDIVVQLGDFGIWPVDDGGDQYLDAVQDQAENSGVLVIVVPGNHEDWDQIENFPTTSSTDRFPPQAKWFRKRIAVLPRVAKFSLGGKSFLSLAGAPSIDFFARSEGVSWWPNEMILPVHVQAVRALGHADYMFGHESPYPSSPAVNNITRSVTGWPSYALKYARQGQALMTEAFNAVMPSVFFHGHYHVRSTGMVASRSQDGKEFTSRIESLGMDGNDDNLVVLEIATGRVSEIFGFGWA